MLAIKCVMSEMVIYLETLLVMQRAWKLILRMCQSSIKLLGFGISVNVQCWFLLLGEFKVVGVRSLSRFAGLRIYFHCI